MRLQIFIPEKNLKQAVIIFNLIGSVLKKEGKHYSHIILKECKPTKKQKKLVRYIIDDLNFSTDKFEKSVKDRLSILMSSSFC